MKEGRIIESGEKDHVLAHPRHEYTQTLIHAAPTLNHRPSPSVREAEIV